MSFTKTNLSDQYFIFRVGPADFAVSAVATREVSDLVPIVGVPHSTAVLRGLCHHRNEFLPVLSLPALLGESLSDADACLLLVMESGDGSWGLPISRALALETLELASIGESSVDAPPSVVMGTASFRDKVVRVLNADRLYQAAADSLGVLWTSRDRPSLPQDHAATLTPQTSC